MSTAAVPPIEERRKPGLSVTLEYPRTPDGCQSCGLIDEPAQLRRWQECDEFDRATGVLVILCQLCEKRLIAAHPRLYIQVDKWKPWPGAMDLCLGCRHAKDLRCQCPLLKANGGPGLPVTPGNHTRAHFNYGGGRGEFKTLFHTPPSKCEGREAVPE